MKLLLSILLSFTTFISFAQKRDNRIVIGTVDTVYSKILNEQRLVMVHVPPGYKSQRYPVLYVLDGEDHFISAAAIIEQLNGLLPPLIVVGITNTVRGRDLTPTYTGPGTGGGENFMAFIEKELIPYIDSHYNAGPFRVISGHSLGGLTVMNAFFNHTAMFGAYFALDPSLWWDGQRWIKKYEDEFATMNLNEKSLFIAIANNIPSGMDTVSVMRDTSEMSLIPRAVIPFVRLLRQANINGLRWASKFYPNERHGTVELNAEYDALRYLFNYYQFRTTQFSGHPELNEDSVLAAHYKMISEKLGYQFLPTENTVNELAYDCMARGEFKVAGKLFIRNTVNHPESANAFDSLGEFYAGQGDKQKAIDAYKKSLSLDETVDTRRKLNELTEKK